MARSVSFRVWLSVGVRVVVGGLRSVAARRREYDQRLAQAARWPSCHGGTSRCSAMASRLMMSYACDLPV